MDIQALASCLASIATIAMLAWFDPKRRRRLRGCGAVRWVRTLLFAVLVAPGVWLIADGRPATFIIWLGVISVAGWAVAQAMVFVQATPISAPPPARPGRGG